MASIVKSTTSAPLKWTSNEVGRVEYINPTIPDELFRRAQDFTQGFTRGVQMVSSLMLQRHLKIDPQQADAVLHKLQVVGGKDDGEFV